MTRWNSYDIFGILGLSRVTSKALVPRHLPMYYQSHDNFPRIGQGRCPPRLALPSESVAFGGEYPTCSTHDLNRECLISF